MRVLLHVCCAPCLSGARIGFEKDDIKITGYWFNPNIHPWREYEKRMDELRRYQEMDPIEILFEDRYPLYTFLDNMLSNIPDRTGSDQNDFMTDLERDNRCAYCYRVRMLYAAKTAKKMGYDGFSTTLLLSKYQNHDLLKEVCEKISFEVGIPFIYKDLRTYWGDSLNRSREFHIYRQNY
ncbi:MAG: epoxyqueuosine reductase QueH, partial [Thermoplasmata archaeon]|nr:epoxyqueuosine reductase QueH [Thermoplasmata archaeon]